MSHNKNLAASFKNAFRGLISVYSTQRNAKIHLGMTLIVIAVGFLLKISAIEWLAVLFAIGFVWASECFNTALEKLTDLVSPQYNDLAKISKDAAAAGVLIAAISAAAIGLIIFLPKITSLLFHQS
jgi:diacylglycerol kinase (ATP)